MGTGRNNRPGLVTARLVAAALLAGSVALLSAQTPRVSADDAVGSLLAAATEQETAAAARVLLESGLPFDEVYARLSSGRRYQANVPRGVVSDSYAEAGTRFFYTLDVPDSYAPERRFPVRVQLHGGVGRIEASSPPSTAGPSRMTVGDEIVVTPSAWRDAPWWSRQQVANLRTILRRVTRSYNVDENRVVVMGVSDGGTGAYFEAMRDTTPFASFIALNGFLVVLRSEMVSGDGDVFPNNLLNKPLFVVNGGRDPLYPTSVVDPYVEHLQRSGVEIAYRPQPEAGHDTSWWPTIRAEVGGFVAAHPRHPYPDTLTWSSSDVPARAHWLVINRLREVPEANQTLPDVNARPSPPVASFGVRNVGMRVTRVLRGSNAQQMGLKAGDVVTAVNGQPTSPVVDLAEVLAGFPAGRPLILSVLRDTQTVRVTGRYSPSALAGDGQFMLPADNAWGRVDLVRVGNRIDATTSGVASFTVLLSPDQFDFSTPITVVVNGRVASERIVQKDLATLVRWASQDEDRTMLFAAALEFIVP